MGLFTHTHLYFNILHNKIQHICKSIVKPKAKKHQFWDDLCGKDKKYFE
nr:MAG TPA: hypothetical protein [Caudoviricetes sp.]